MFNWSDLHGKLNKFICELETKNDGGVVCEHFQKPIAHAIFQRGELLVPLCVRPSNVLLTYILMGVTDWSFAGYFFTNLGWAIGKKK